MPGDFDSGEGSVEGGIVFPFHLHDVGAVVVLVDAGFGVVFDGI